MVGMETLTEPEAPPSLPRVRWRAGRGRTVCILRHGHVARPLLVRGECGDAGVTKPPQHSDDRHYHPSNQAAPRTSAVVQPAARGG